MLDDGAAICDDVTVETETEEHEATQLDEILDSLSEHQAQVLDCIENGHHVTVQANPGAGKTRLILQIVSAFPTRRVLIVSFNTELVGNTELELAQIRDFRSAWTHTHTYHGLFGTLASETVFDDIVFSKLLRNVDFGAFDMWKYRDLDILVIDEAQDLKPHFVILLLCILAFVVVNKTTLQVVFLYDQRQTLHSFYPINKADARFAQLAQLIFGPYLELKQWSHVVFPISYRIQPQSATFLNVLQPACQIVSGHTREEAHNYVTLFLLDIYRDVAATVLDIVRREAGFKQNYGEILVLVNSLRSKRSPARAVVDMLVAAGIPVHVLRAAKSNGDDKTCVADVRKNKVNFLTDCGAKGLEFRTVIKINEAGLLGEEFVTNSLFVALSRHKQRLYILQNARYTTQCQIDDLLSHPTITQSVLRVIVKRQIPTELPDAKHNESNATSDAQCAVSCDSLFTFLDVEHMEHLLQHVDVQSIGADQFGNGEQDTFVDAEEITSYLAENIISQNANTIFTDMSRVVNQALLLALEFFVSRRIPRCVLDVHAKTQFANTAHGKLMFHKLETPMIHITDLYNDNNDAFFENVVAAMPDFAAAAVVSDAFNNYNDLLFQVNEFAFAMTDRVKFRLRTLRCILESLISNHELLTSKPVGKLLWNEDVTGLFVRDAQPLELLTNIPVCSQDMSLFVFISHEAAISNNDRLRALAATMAARTKVETTDDDMFPNVFVINIVSLCVEKLELTSDMAQPLAQLPTTVDEKSNKRYLPCEFLMDALKFKFWSDDVAEGDDVQTNKRSREEEDLDFVANIHKKMKAYEEEQQEELEEKSTTKKQKTEHSARNDDC